MKKPRIWGLCTYNHLTKKPYSTYRYTPMPTKWLLNPHQNYYCS
nr:MAG TPA: hypothetical protein [Caudoviricetes sp.]